MTSRVIDHVYAQLWPDYGKPTHPEDVAALRDTIADVVGHALAYVDGHTECQRWEDTHPHTCRDAEPRNPATPSGPQS